MRPVGARQQPGASLRDCFATCGKLLFPENRSDRCDQHQSNNHGRNPADARCHSFDPTVQHKRFRPRLHVGIAFRSSHCSRFAGALRRHGSGDIDGPKMGVSVGPRARSLASATTHAGCWKIGIPYRNGNRLPGINNAIQYAQPICRRSGNSTAVRPTLMDQGYQFGVVF